MPVKGLLDFADELFALPLNDFTPRRDALVKEHKADKDLAAALKALRKPSLAAWVVNLLVRREPQQVDQMLTVGVALREAQANLDGEELRVLTRQRRQLTAAITTQARGLAGQVGVKVTEAVAEQVEATLTAAMVDEAAAAAIRTGLLVAPITTTGVESIDLAAVLAVPDAVDFVPTSVAAPRPELHVVPDDAERPLRDAEAALAEAEAVLSKAVADHDAAAKEVADLEARSLQVQADVEELKRRLAKLDSQAEELDDELADAEDVLAESGGVVRQATRERDAALKKADKLRKAASGGRA